MMPVRVDMQKTDLHPLMPLYLVIFIGFVGYSMMVTLFVPMLMYDHAFLGGFLAAMLIPLPLPTYGIVAVAGGLLLITYKKPEALD